MLTIGEIAPLGQVSPRMLRHYDEIGLLKPDRVDSASGYRFYSARQLESVHRIVALRDMGFGLEQIRQILAEDIRWRSFAECCGCAEVRSSNPSEKNKIASVESKPTSEHWNGATS